MAHCDLPFDDLDMRTDCSSGKSSRMHALQYLARVALCVFCAVAISQATQSFCRFLAVSCDMVPLPLAHVQHIPWQPLCASFFVPLRVRHPDLQ